MEFPNANIVCNVPRLPKSSANYWGEQSIWTHPYWPQPAHSHWQHSPTQATTQEFLVFIRHPELQLKEYHVLNPLSWANTQEIRSELNSRNTSNSTFEASPKSLVDHAYRTNNPRLQQQNHLAWDTYRQALPASRPLGGWLVPPSAQRL